MKIHSNTPTSKVALPPSLLDMVSERSSKAMYQSNRNKSAITSDESSIRNHNKQINKINTELPKTTELAEENSGGIFDIADVSSDLSDIIFELADYISELEERISALEEREE